MHLCPLFLLTLAGFVGAQDLDDTYTLGRITAPVAQAHGFVDSRIGVATLGTNLETQFGKADSWSLVLPLTWARAAHLSWQGDDQDAISMFQFSGARLSMHPISGLILDGVLTSGNLWMASDQQTDRTGFDSDVPKTLKTSLFGHYLSNEGRIPLNDQTIPFAFLYGPIVGPGQLEVQGNIDNTFLDTSELHGYSLKAAYGIVPQTQIWFGFTDTLIKGLAFGPGNSVGNGYPKEVERMHYQSLSLGGDWVSSMVRAGVLANHFLYPVTSTPSLENFSLKHWDLSAYGGFLGGPDQTTAQQVAGNWNGISGRNLSQRQFDLEDSISLSIGDDKNATSSHFYSLNGNARYGILDVLTAGMEYDLLWSSYLTTKAFYLTATYSNIPRRTTGPSQVSPLEYQIGQLPKAGQGMVTMHCLLLSSEYYNTFGMYSELQTDPFTPIRSNWDNFRRGWTRSSIPRTNYDVLGMYGITDNLAIVAQISKVDAFRSAYWDDELNALVLNPGIFYHNDRASLQLRIPYFSGKKIVDLVVDDNDNLRAITRNDSRFGPVQFDVTLAL